MSKEPPLDYDDREARAILAETLQRLSPTRDTEAAALKLAKELCSLLKELDFVLDSTHNKPQLLVFHPRGGQSGVWLNWAGGDFRVSLDGKSGEPVAITYDTLTKSYIGTEPDSFITPEPGQPRRMRSALAVLAEAVSERLAKL